MKKILISILCLCALTACSSTPTDKQTVCTITQGESSSTVTITHDDKVLLKSAEEMVSDIASAQIGKEAIEATLSATKAALEGIEGIVYTYEVNDETFAISTIYDWQVIDMDKLVEIGMLQSAQESIPVGEYVKNMETVGYTCK